MIDGCLKEAIVLGASDLHITVHSPPVARVHGRLVRVGTTDLKPSETEAMLRELLSPEAWARFSEKGSVDFSYSAPEMGRFRVSSYRQRGSIALAIRVIPHFVPNIDKLRIPPVIKDLAMRPKGLLLITGPDGSGKSTTAAAVIDFVNSQREVHIITLEDPIEYLHRHQKGIVHQREMGVDAFSWVDAIRSALRQDPDVLFLGEIPDDDTARLALTAAETGHLVIATLPTVGVAPTLQYLFDLFSSSKRERVKGQVASVLQGVVSQDLVSRVDMPGRVAAFEVLVATGTVRNLVRDGKIHQLKSAIQTGTRHGMLSMEVSLEDLYTSGIISKEDFRSRCQVED